MNVRGHDELSPLLFGGGTELVNIKLCPADGAVDPGMLRAEIASALDQARLIDGTEDFDESDLRDTDVAQWVASI